MASGFGVLKSMFVPRIVPVILSLDTGIYADGDVLADTQVISGAARDNGGPCSLESVQVLDEDDQGVALDLLFLDANVSIGTENAAPSVTDANARNILGLISIAAADYKDLGASRIATVHSIGLVLKAATGSRDLYIAAITRGGTPTYTASGIRLRLGFM